MKVAEGRPTGWDVEQRAVFVRKVPGRFDFKVFCPNIDQWNHPNGRK